MPWISLFPAWQNCLRGRQTFRRSAFLLTIFVCIFASLVRVEAAPAPQAVNPGAAPAVAANPSGQITLPGPLRSFLRMAGISQKVAPDEVLPFLARQIVIQGYHDARQKDATPNEFLILLKRYIAQARAVQRMAGASGVVRVSSCAEATPLLRVLGFRIREGCGADVTIETLDSQQGFLAADSGFPLAQLEDAVRAGKPFEFQYSSPPVPLLFTESDWSEPDKNAPKGAAPDVLDSLVNDGTLARLYWAFSRLDPETRDSLRKSPGLHALQPLAPLLDFYGSQIAIRSGRVMVPGGARSEAAWTSLVGASPASPGEFVTKLMGKDEGWLAAYFDALSRVNRTQQAYLADPARLQRDYQALRGNNLSPSPLRFVFFRPDPNLLLLFTGLQLDADGQPHVPGNLQAWKDILRAKSSYSLVSEWGRRAGDWGNSSQLVEGMIGLSRVRGDNGPMQLYLLLSEIDHGRLAAQRLSPGTVKLMAEKFTHYRQQYLIFSEFRTLDNNSIAKFLAVADSVDEIRDPTVKANALGIFQAEIGLWQILARQGEIPAERLNDSWQRVIAPFARASSSPEVFLAGRASLREMLRDASGTPDPSQAGIVALVAGPPQSNPEDAKVRDEMARRIAAVLSAQRLVSLDTLFSLSEDLDRRAQAEPVDDTMLAMAGELREFEMPRPLFTTQERAEWSGGSYEIRHTQTQMNTDLAKVLSAPPSTAALTAARGQLTSFLRDTLVGLNYAYYEPPGAQMLHTNPMFVRSHDFSEGVSLRGEHWDTPFLLGRGATASGGARLVGSLANLPYVLSEVEQDFIVPESVQALIWQDLVPTLLTSATVPRWWGVSRNELHASTLYQTMGEELLAGAATNDTLRARVLDILSDRLVPTRASALEQALRGGQTDAAGLEIMPGETFYLAAEFRRRFPAEGASSGPAGRELEALANSDPTDVSFERLSADFGVPHPEIANTYTRELIAVKPFPAFLGYSSRLLAESWDSSNLYFARLADEMGYSPAMLNRVVPELTRRMVEKIFASHFEDWPAVLRAMRETGDEFRQGKIAVMPEGVAAPRATPGD
jgi:hypothetical protein